MNKKTLIKELEIIERGILKYFNETDSRYLTILDGDSREYLNDYEGYNLEGYTGVTVKYLREYLYNKKYSKSMISYVLLRLLSEGDVQTLYCSNIKQVVFEPTKSEHGTNYFINSYDDDDEFISSHNIQINDYKEYYNSLIKSYYGISNYLNK